MHTTTRVASLLIVSALAVTTAACSSDEEGSTGVTSSRRTSPSPSEPALDRVGSILPGEGWTVVDAEGVGTTTGEYEVNAAAAAAVDPPEVTMTWRAASDYDGYVADRENVSSAESVEVAGGPGRLYTYSDHDFTVLRAVEGASFIELRGTFLSRAEFDAFLADVSAVTEDEFAAAIVDAGVTPER